MVDVIFLISCQKLGKDLLTHCGFSMFIALFFMASKENAIAIR